MRVPSSEPNIVDRTLRLPTCGSGAARGQKRRTGSGLAAGSGKRVVLTEPRRDIRMLMKRNAGPPVPDGTPLLPGYTPLTHSASSREEPPMPTGVFDSLLLGHVWGTDELRAIFSDENRVQKWFDYEAALALAQAELGIVPPAAAAEIAAKAKVGNVDLAKVAAEIRRIKHPLVPALRALQAAC